MGNCLQDGEQVKALLKNYQPPLSNLLDSNPKEKNITLLEDQITQYQERIWYLSDTIGVAYLKFDGKNPYAKIKPRISPTNSNKTRRGRSNMRKIYLSPPTPLRYVYASLKVKQAQNCAMTRTAQPYDTLNT